MRCHCQLKILGPRDSGELISMVPFTFGMRRHTLFRLHRNHGERLWKVDKTYCPSKVRSGRVGVRSIVINPSVCVSVCLSASISLEPLDRPSRNFLCRSPVAGVRTSSGGVALPYVLPVYG